MKTITFLFLTSLLFVAQSSQDSPELREATELTSSLVKLYKEQKFDQALPLAKRALEIRERLLPPGDQQISSSLSNLAEVYIAKRNYSEARKSLLRLLENDERRLRPDDIGLALTLDRVALMYRRQGDQDKAEEAYKRAISIKEKALGTDNADLAHSLVGLAETHRDRKNFDQAAPIYKRALLIYGKHSGNDLDFERTSEAYTCLCYESGQTERIKDLKEIWKQFAPPDAPEEPAAGTILNGKALMLAKPDYPPQARASRVSGVVVVKVKIDETGRVIAAHDMCVGPPYISESSVRAAYQSRFSPTKLSGMPIQVEGIIHYRFVAQ